MERWTVSLRSALKHNVVQASLAIALLVPLLATAGQFLSSGFWRQSSGVALLFWPGQDWQWTVSMPVWISMGAMLTSYLAGIAWLLRKRTLSAVVLSGVGALIAANAVAAALNYVAGWRELQVVSSMELAGKANRAIFSFWHNPAWEEVVFRGIPLILLFMAVRGKDGARPRWALWCYYVVPSLVMAAYHVPGHGPSRLVDTFLLSLAFAWMALRYSFFAPLVIHYVFDAVMTMSLGKMPNIPTREVAWLADHAALLNSTWTIALLLWLASIPVTLILRRYRGRPPSGARPAGEVLHHHEHRAVL